MPQHHYTVSIYHIIMMYVTTEPLNIPLASLTPAQSHTQYANEVRPQLSFI